MTNKRKKRTRALAAKLRGTYQTAANIRRGNRGRRVDGRSTDACRAASTRATLSRVLADMTEDTTRWVFRDVPELLPYLLNNELDAIAQTHSESLAKECEHLAIQCSAL